MLSLKPFFFTTIFVILTKVGAPPPVRTTISSTSTATTGDFITTPNLANIIDTTTCNRSGWFYPNTCSPQQCQMANNTACNASATVNMTIIEQSISSMTCNASITQSTNPICKNVSLIQTFQRGMVGHGIVAVYCTDKFLIIFTNDIPNHPLNLMAVPHPPAGGTAGSNAGQNTGGYTGCVTRYNVMQFNAYKIPLNPVDLNVSSLNNNNQIGNQSMFVYNPAIFKTPILGTNPLQYYPVPAEGTVGVTTSGIGLKIPYSQNGFQSWEECSLDNCNGHVPIGNGYHYHGDPFNCLYNQSDYPTTQSHPPLIGFGLDGFSIYGRYLNISAPGANISLDLCGGHSHPPYGYHYHTQVKQITASDSGQQIPLGTPYYVFLPGITNCMKNDLFYFSKIKEYFF